MAAHTVLRAAERKDLIVLVVAVTLALLVDLAVFAFMGSH